jgi:hypothetical protein
MSLFRPYLAAESTCKCFSDEWHLYADPAGQGRHGDRRKLACSHSQHSLLLIEQGIKPIPGQVMILPIGNDMRQITETMALILAKEDTFPL